MLILARKPGESIMIGDDIEIRVIDIGGGNVRLAVIGPGPAYPDWHDDDMGLRAMVPSSPLRETACLVR